MFEPISNLVIFPFYPGTQDIGGEELPNYGLTGMCNYCVTFSELSPSKFLTRFFNPILFLGVDFADSYTFFAVYPLLLKSAATLLGLLFMPATIFLGPLFVTLSCHFL